MTGRQLDLAVDAARRHLLRRANIVALLIRHCANLVVSVVELADPTGSTAGKAWLAALGGWAMYRLATRSPALAPTAADYLVTLAVCLAIPQLTSDQHFYASNSAPVAIAGTAVISFAVQLPVRLTLPMTVVLAATYAWGSAQLIGWSHVPAVINLYYFFLQWATSAAIRLMMLRVAGAVDEARADRQSADVAEQVSAAVRDFDREQLRILHDTAASTLLLVGQGTPLPPQRLADQARRDMNILNSHVWVPRRTEADVVAALRANAAYAATPVRFTGLQTLVTDGRIAYAVAAAAREALTNIDRHADATLAVVAIQPDRITITDDGSGFDPATPSNRHGIAQSIVARMRHVQGAATISSRPGHGARVELRWPVNEPQPVLPVGDPDRLIERARIGYGLALMIYALVNLAAMVPQRFSYVIHSPVQLGLACAAALCTVVAWPVVVSQRSALQGPAAALLLVVALSQTASVPAGDLGSQLHWSLSTIGWCLVPLVLNLPVRRGAALLTSFWAATAVLAVVREPTTPMAVSLGLGTASILAVQLFATLFNGLIRDAAVDAHTESEALKESLTRQRIAEAVQVEFESRYADLADSVVPLLTDLARGGPVDDGVRRRAQVECRQLRMLFDQAAMFGHPLLRALRPVIDTAERRNVDVTVHASGNVPPLSDTEADRIAARIGTLLEHTGAAARLVLIAEPDALVVSVVCQKVTRPDMCGGAADDLTVVGDTVWLTVRHLTSAMSC